MKTNEEILLGVKRGDASDFELLYARYKEKLHNFILAVSNYDYYLTEEVVQITFVKIWETRECLANITAMRNDGSIKATPALHAEHANDLLQSQKNRTGLLQ